ncbi:hypothetical protein D3C85_1004570 [compost metagenome]
MANAIWVQVSERAWSLRTNDHCKIVTGPVSIPFTHFEVKDCAKEDHFTVIGFGLETSP